MKRDAQQQNLFQMAWEAFEVGNFEEVEKLQVQYPNNFSILHLYFIAYYLDHKQLPKSFETSQLSENSVLQPLLKSIYFQKKFNFQEAFYFWKEFLVSSRNYLTPLILTYGVSTSIEAEQYEHALQLIELDSSTHSEAYFAELKLKALYYLKRFPDLIQHYKKNYKSIPENSEHFFMVGMALLHLKKYKESEQFFQKVDSFSLPSFEEIKQEMKEKIQKIPLLERKPNLNPDELRELGFAYLFTNQYQKAEKIFQLALNKVA